MSKDLYPFTFPLTSEQLEDAVEYYRTACPDFFENFETPENYAVSSKSTTNFGVYSEAKNRITLSKGAHHGNVLKANETLLHELVHWKQFQLYKHENDRKFLDLGPYPKHSPYKKYHGPYFQSLGEVLNKTFGVNATKPGSRLDIDTLKNNLKVDDESQLMLVIKPHKATKETFYFMKSKKIPDDISSLCKGVHKQMFGGVKSISVYRASKLQKTNADIINASGVIQNPIGMAKQFLSLGSTLDTMSLIHEESFDLLPHHLTHKELNAIRYGSPLLKTSFDKYATTCLSTLNDKEEAFSIIANPKHFGDRYPALLRALYEDWSRITANQLKGKRYTIGYIGRDAQAINYLHCRNTDTEEKVEALTDLVLRMKIGYSLVGFPRMTFTDFKKAIVSSAKLDPKSVVAKVIMDSSYDTPLPKCKEERFNATRTTALEQDPCELKACEVERFVIISESKNNIKKDEKKSEKPSPPDGDCIQFGLF